MINSILVCTHENGCIHLSMWSCVCSHMQKDLLFMCRLLSPCLHVCRIVYLCMHMFVCVCGT